MNKDEDIFRIELSGFGKYKEFVIRKIDLSKTFPNTFSDTWVADNKAFIFTDSNLKRLIKRLDKYLDKHSKKSR